MWPDVLRVVVYLLIVPADAGLGVALAELCHTPGDSPYATRRLMWFAGQLAALGLLVAAAARLGSFT